MMAELERGVARSWRCTRSTMTDDARMFVRRVRAYVREVEVERDERASFALADIRDLRVHATAEILIAHGHRVVALSLQQRGELDGKVLIDLEREHGYPARGMYTV